MTNGYQAIKSWITKVWLTGCSNLFIINDAGGHPNIRCNIYFDQHWGSLDIDG